MKVSRLSERENKFFYAAVIVIGFIALYIFAIEPLLTKWWQLDKKISADKQKLEWMDRIITNKASITDNYKKAASAARMAGSEEEETATFLSEIESLANLSGVRINEIRPLPTKHLDLYNKFYADVALEGTMASISDLMRRIQGSTQLLAVYKFSLSSKQYSGTNILMCRLIISKIAIL